MMEPTLLTEQTIKQISERIGNHAHIHTNDDNGVKTLLVEYEGRRFPFAMNVWNFSENHLGGQYLSSNSHGVYQNQCVTRPITNRAKNLEAAQ